MKTTVFSKRVAGLTLEMAIANALALGFQVVVNQQGEDGPYCTISH